jgi:WD40 repeat protein
MINIHRRQRQLHNCNLYRLIDCFPLIITGVVKVWDVRNVSEKIHLPSEQRVAINCVKFDASSTIILAASDSGTLKVYDTNKSELIQELEGHEGSVQSFAIEPNGQWFVSGSSDATFRLWQA